MEEIMDTKTCPNHRGSSLVLINSYVEYEETFNRNGDCDTYKYIVLMYQCSQCGKVFRAVTDYIEV